MNSQDPREQYLTANIEELSRAYFDYEGTTRRGKHFEAIWLAIGFQCCEAPFTLERVCELLGLPDLASGTPSAGMIGWLMQSTESTGQQDIIVGYDVESGAVYDFWSNSVVPECSPARHMIAFADSEISPKKR